MSKASGVCVCVELERMWRGRECACASWVVNSSPKTRGPPLCAILSLFLSLSLSLMQGTQRHDAYLKECGSGPVFEVL